MFTRLFRRGTYPHSAARLRRIAAALVAATAAVLLDRARGSRRAVSTTG
jgi:hypothetical protein